MGKVLVSMPDGLLARVDREAQRRHVTRSALLQLAVQRELGWPDEAEIDAALEQGRSALRGLGPFNSVDLFARGREERDARDRRR